LRREVFEPIHHAVVIFSGLSRHSPVSSRASLAYNGGNAT
jgi:hypothetical protein